MGGEGNDEGGEGGPPGVLEEHLPLLQLLMQDLESFVSLQLVLHLLVLHLLVLHLLVLHLLVLHLPLQHLLVMCLCVLHLIVLQGCQLVVVQCLHMPTVVFSQRSLLCRCNLSCTSSWCTSLWCTSPWCTFMYCIFLLCTLLGCNLYSASIRQQSSFACN